MGTILPSRMINLILMVRFREEHGEKIFLEIRVK